MSDTVITIYLIFMTLANIAFVTFIGIMTNKRLKLMDATLKATQEIINSIEQYYEGKDGEIWKKQ